MCQNSEKFSWLSAQYIATTLYTEDANADEDANTEEALKAAGFLSQFIDINMHNDNFGRTIPISHISVKDY